MRIGTPLSPGATRVMLLGADELAKEVIIALQRLGVETIAVDRHPNAPGHQVAHRAHVINIADPKAVRAVIEKERPTMVVPGRGEIAIEELEKIEKERISTVIPTARAARLAMNREEVRRLAAEELGLPTPAYAFVDNINALQTAIGKGIGYPCILKPASQPSARGQSVIDGPNDLMKIWHHVMSGARIGQTRAIAEQVIRFDYEVILPAVRASGTDGSTETYYCDPIGYAHGKDDYGESWQPQAMSPKALDTAREIAGKITGNLGGRGVFGVRLFVKGDQVWFSEVNPQLHDTGLVTLISQRQSLFELHARAILGLPVDVSLRHSGASAVIYGGMDARDLAFEGVDQALRVPGTDLRLFGKPESRAQGRMGVALAWGKDIDDCRFRARQAAAMVRPVRS